MQGTNIPAAMCSVTLFIGDNQSHRLDIMLMTKRSNYKKQQKELLKMLDTAVKSTGKMSSNEVLIPKEIFSNTKLLFTDIKGQTPSVQKALAKLVERGIVKNRATFGGDEPMIWGEYIPWYIKANYNKNLADAIPDRDGVTFQDAVNSLGIQMNGFVTNTSYFELLIKAAIAGVKIPDTSEYGLQEFQRLMDTTYAEQRQQIRNREYSFFGERKIMLSEALGAYDLYRNNRYYYSYNPVSKQLMKQETANASRPYNLNTPFAPEYYEKAQQRKDCVDKGTITKVVACKTMLKDMYSISYGVATKGELLNSILNSMDAGLFDPYWAKKKTTQIEAGNQVLQQ
jgi:hypothetical protein